MAKQHPITAIIDTREQRPLRLSDFGLAVEVGTLQHGDYSVRHPDMRRWIAIERKSLEDFCACCGRERDRFERELLALRGYRYRAVVVESDLAHVTGHDYRGKMNPRAILASIARWSLDFQIPIVLAGSHQGAAEYVASALDLVARTWLQAANTACADMDAPDCTNEGIAIQGRAVSGRLAKV